MLSSQDIQNLYIDLYVKLRNYIWPIDIVSTIADLEIACYQLFPCIESIRYILTRLKLMCRDQLVTDSEFLKCMDTFEDKLINFDGFYNKLMQVEEVISV